jgi:hypothetical protein
MVIWYIFPVLLFCGKKNLATLVPWCRAATLCLTRPSSEFGFFDVLEEPWRKLWPEFPRKRNVVVLFTVLQFCRKKWCFIVSSNVKMPTAGNLDVDILMVSNLEVDIMMVGNLEVDILMVGNLEVDTLTVNILEVDILEVSILMVDILEVGILTVNILKVDIT